MGLDDVLMETRTSLDNNVDRDDLQRKIVRPPANLLVFEGDVLDSEASELDSYLLSTCDFYGDFLLLDPCDAPSVFDFLQGKHSGKENSVARQGSPAPSKSQANVFTSPNARSAGTGCKAASGKVLGGLDSTQKNPDQPSTQETSPDDKHWSDPVEPNFTDDVEKPHPDDIGDPVGDYSDDEDPWKPLNPHEPGSLKIRPYRRVKGSLRGVIGTLRKKTLTSIFPVAKMVGVIIPEHAKSFEAQQSQQEEHYGSQSPPRFEKYLASFEFGEENSNVFGDLKDDNGSDIGINFDYNDPDMPNDIDVDPDVPTYPDEIIAATPKGTHGTQDDRDTRESLDDLCRSHLVRGL
ncbi:Condensin-2 complex subunit H2 [Zea mays]|uniref:Condensin-2 complex subunit H2 n=1 Tax=Zea mays TaxID=4577 RepID=A0A1D6EX50_MAIZE|nr:Condensin-2 complex subunit H2 [Zea mays]